ncbi:MAG: hypothetical protein NT002_01165 [candidate division Zixibacteria bacterium]|nr:hypothetical protein [candidate division Zixibacteria bacterium]
MNKRLSLMMANLLILIFIELSAFAGVPQIMSYQGRLTDNIGNPLPDNVYSFKFSIYDMSVGGYQLWTTLGYVPIQTKNGLFSHLLGSTNPLPDSLAKYDSLWLGITVGLDPEMTPRTSLASTIFSFRSAISQFADTARHSLDKTIDASELATGILDTARYSAYEDLESEDKIGAEANQLASGNHSHEMSGPKLTFKEYVYDQQGPILTLTPPYPNWSQNWPIIDSINISVPDSGYVVVKALVVLYLPNGNQEIRIGLTSSQATDPGFGEYTSSSNKSDEDYLDMSIEDFIKVSGPSTLTIYLKGTANFPFFYISKYQLSSIIYPLRYQ